MSEPVDAEFTEDPGTALAIAEPSASLAPVVSPEDAREAMRQYMELCEAVLTDDDYQKFSQKKKVGSEWITETKRFKKKSAVKKLQTFFGVDVRIREMQRDDLGDGHFAFRVIATAQHKNGRVVEATGGCSTFEERFDLTPYDNEGDAKFEARKRKALARSYHDVLSTAETRATNRAVMNAIGVGGGEVTADEANHNLHHTTPQRTRRKPPLTGAQQAVMYCQRIGVSDADRHSYIRMAYGVESFNDLNGDDLHAVCEHFQKVKRDERNAS